MADITMSIGLDAQDAINSAHNLQMEIKDIFDETVGKNYGGKIGKQFDSIKKSMSNASRIAFDLEKQMADLENKKIGNTAQYNQVLSIISKLNSEISNYKQQLLTTTNPQDINILTQQLKAREATLKSWENRRTQLEQSGKAFVLGKDTEEYQRLVERLGDANNRMSLLVSSARELVSTGNANERWTAQLSRRFTELRTRIVRIISLLKKITKPINDAIKSVARLQAKLMGIGKTTDKQNMSFKKMLNQVLKYGLGIRSLFILWRKLRAYTADALKLMATQFEEVDADVSALINSFNAMKLSMGTMVQPLMHALAPALIYIIDLISSAATALANFFAIITGQSYIYKAKKADDSYADSIKGVGSAAKEANKELAEYDNLLVISQPKDSGGGGSGAGDGLTGTFEKTVAESDFAELIKEAIESGNWEGVGIAFADKLNVITDRFDTWINTKFRPAGEKWAVRIARILNGFTDKVNGKKMGKTLADAFNSAFSIVNNFLTNYEFEKLGIKIADLGSGFVQNIDSIRKYYCRREK